LISVKNTRISVVSKTILKGILTCKCKGARKYVHGTDIYNMFFKSLSSNSLFSGKFKDISISFKDIITSKAVHYEVYDYKVKDEDAQALINFTVKNKKYYAILKGAKESIKESYPFNEEDITEYCLVDVYNKKITLLEKVRFTPIEIFTAMNKKLLNSSFPPDKNWLMTKFESTEYHEVQSYKKVDMFIKKAIRLKLIKTDICIDKVKIGSIYFSEAE